MHTRPDGSGRVADMLALVRPPARNWLRLVWAKDIPCIAVTIPGPFRLLLTGRFGGASQEGFAELNLSYWVGDDPGLVDRNHERFAAALGRSLDTITLPRQIHSTEILELDECRRRGDRVPCDGLVLRADRDRGLAAHMLSGDCLTVLLIGSDTCVVVHAGWRGLVDGIVGKGVEALGGAPPLGVFFGPAIGPCCYEVGEDVAGLVQERFGSGAVVRSAVSPKPRLDLWECATMALEDAGVRREHVMNPELCTMCHRDVFYSHRADGPATGRHTALVWVPGEESKEEWGSLSK